MGVLLKFRADSLSTHVAMGRLCPVLALQDASAIESSYHSHVG